MSLGVDKTGKTTQEITMSDEGSGLDRMGDWYADDPIFRAVLGFAKAVPSVNLIVAPVDEAIVALVRRRDMMKLKILVDEVRKTVGKLPQDLAQDEDFIHCCVEAFEAVRRTRTDEKIRLFARLLANGATGDNRGDIEEYEELLLILKELTVLELRILIAGERVARGGPFNLPWRRETQNVLDTQKEFGISNLEAPALLFRLQGKGLLRRKDPRSIVALSEAPDMWELTGLWHKLKRYVQDKEGRILGE